MMENKKELKQKIIIIGLVIIIILWQLEYTFVGKTKETSSTEKQTKTVTTSSSNLNNGISNDGENSSNQDMIDYINNNLVLESATVDEFNTYYNTKEWGLSNIKVKNNGDKSISAITITVYFNE